MNKKEKIPSRGYSVPIGFGWDYRATAIAYLEREGLFTIGHANGNSYTLTQLKNARLGQSLNKRSKTENYGLE